MIALDACGAVRRRRGFGVRASLLSVCLVLLACTSPALAAPSIHEFSGGLSAGSGPDLIAPGPDGAMWFTEFNGNRIGRIAPDGSITQYPSSGPALSPGAQPSGIVTGPDGNLWFTEYGTGEIGELNPSSGQLVGEYPISGGAASEPEGIAVGPDGGVWFTERNANRIGRIDPSSKAITEILLNVILHASVQPVDLVTGPDGALWVTLLGGSVDRVDVTDDAVTGYPLPAANSSPEGIVSGPGGDLWVADLGAGDVAQINPGAVSPGTSSGIAEFATGGTPLWVSAAGDGGLWLTDNTDDALQRFDPSSGTTTIFGATQGVTGDVTGAAEDPNGNVWFTEFNSNKVGEVTFPSTPGPVPSPPDAAITTPANGATFTTGEAVKSSFACTEGAGGPGLESCLDQSGRPSGSPLDTAAAGLHTFTVVATSSDGQTATARSSYTVANRPSTLAAIRSRRHPTISGLVRVGRRRLAKPGHTLICNAGKVSGNPRISYEWTVSEPVDYFPGTPTRTSVPDRAAPSFPFSPVHLGTSSRGQLPKRVALNVSAQRRFVVAILPPGSVLTCQATATTYPRLTTFISVSIPTQAARPEIDTSHAPLSHPYPRISPNVGVNGENFCALGIWKNHPDPRRWVIGWYWLNGGNAVKGKSVKVTPTAVYSPDPLQITISPRDAGHVIACKVTATNAAGSTSAWSNSYKVPPQPVAAYPAPWVHITQGYVNAETPVVPDYGWVAPSDGFVLGVSPQGNAAGLGPLSVVVPAVTVVAEKVNLDCEPGLVPPGKVLPAGLQTNTYFVLANEAGSVAGGVPIGQSPGGATTITIDMTPGFANYDVEGAYDAPLDVETDRSGGEPVPIYIDASNIDDAGVRNAGWRYGDNLSTIAQCFTVATSGGTNTVVASAPIAVSGGCQGLGADATYNRFSQFSNPQIDTWGPNCIDYISSLHDFNFDVNQVASAAQAAIDAAHRAQAL